MTIPQFLLLYSVAVMAPALVYVLWRDYGRHWWRAWYLRARLRRLAMTRETAHERENEKEKEETRRGTASPL